MAVKFANLASTTLSSAITNSATSIAVADASLFPTLGSGDYFYATIGEGSGSEIVKVTAISSNTLTVTRAQDGTTASAFSSGETIALRVVAAALDDIASQAQSAADTESVSIDGDTMTGDLTVPNLTTTGNLTVQGDNLDITQSIRHRGDENTGINFFSDQVAIKTGGTERLTFTNSDINIRNTQVFFNSSMGIGASTYSPIENNIDSERNWLNFHRSNNASYVEFTNRTPLGKIVLSGGLDGGGGEVQRLEIQGGSGTKSVKVLASTNLDLSSSSNFKMGGLNVITSGRNIQNIGNVNIGGYYAMDGTTIIDTSKNLTNIGSISANDLVTENNTTKDSQGPYDWVTVGSGSRAAALRINDIAGANYIIRAGGYGLRFMKHVDAATDSFRDVMRFTATGVGDTTPHVVISNNLSVGGEISSGTITVSGEIYATNSSNNLVIGNSASGNIYLGGGNNNTSNIYLQTGSSTAVSINSSNQSTFHGDVVVQGGLTVQGTTTTIDTANLNVEDNNITLNYSTGDSSATANGAGITIQDAVNGSTDASMTWSAAGDNFNFSHSVNTLGYLQHSSFLYSRNNLLVLNSAGNGWNTWATRSNGQFNLSVGTISSGAITSSASVIASGNSNSFGNTTISNLTVTSVTASGSITASGNSNSFGNTTVGALTATSLSLPSSHSKQKITMFGGGHEWIGTSNNTLEISGASINLNGAQGTGTPNLKMGGTTVIDSSRRARTSVLLPTDTTLYATDATLSYYSSSNAVYLNGAGANGWLRLNASGNANDRTAINLFGQNAGDNITFKTAGTQRMNIDSGGNLRWGSANTAILDPSRNLTNIGSISSGAITSSGNIGGATLTSSSYASVGSIVAADPGSSYYSYNNRIGSGLAVVGTFNNFGDTVVTGLAKFTRAGNTNRGNIAIGPQTSGANKWSSISGAHYNQTTGSGNGSGSSGIFLIGSHAMSGGNDVYIGGGPYEMNPATTIRFHTHTATTHNQGGTEVAKLDSSGHLYLQTGDYKIGSTTVINSSRNITINQKIDNSLGNLLDHDGTNNYIKGGNAGSNILYIEASGVYTNNSLIVGNNASKQVIVRHIDGKYGNSNSYENLYLNYYSGNAVILGRSDLNTTLQVHGPIQQGTTTVIDTNRNITVNQNLISSSGNPLVLTGNGGANIELYGNGNAYFDATQVHLRGTNGSGGGALAIAGTTVIDAARNLTFITSLNNQTIGADGAGFTGMGFGYSSNTLTRAVGSGVQWYKVASFYGGVKAITMRVSAGGDNTNATDTFFISVSSYGMKANIMKFPSTRYNGSKLMEVRTKFVSGPTYEIWVKLNSITTSAGSLHISMNDSGVVSSLSAGTEPTYNSSYDATLVVTVADRSDYAIQTTGKIETNEGYAVNDQVFIDSNRNISNVGNITATGQLRLNDGADIAWAGGYGSNKPLIAANGNLLRFYTNGASGGVELELSSSSANFQDNSITTTGNIARTGTEGREIQTYMASSYTTNDIVAGHEYGWYNDYWRIGISRSGNTGGEAFRFNYSGSYVAQIGTTGIFDGTGYRVSGTTVIDSSRNLTYIVGLYGNSGTLNHYNTNHVFKSTTSNLQAQINDTGIGVGVSPQAVGAGNTTAGLSLYSDGRIFASKSGNTVMSLNRNSSNGVIAEFRYAGNTIGNLGVEGGDSLFIQSDGSTGGGLRFHQNGVISPVRNGAVVNNTIDLGTSTQQFRELYLGSGLFMSGSQIVDSSRNFSGASLTLNGSASYVLDITSGQNYAARISHNRVNHSTTHSDGLFLQNTNSTNTANYIAIGLSTNSTDGQHHRAHIRARHDTSMTYGGILELRTRGSGGANNVGVRIDANSNVDMPNGKLAVNRATATNNPALDVAGVNNTDGTAAFRPVSNKGTRVSHVHHGANGDWYIRSANTSGIVYIQDGGGTVSVGGATAISGTLSTTGKATIDNAVVSDSLYIRGDANGTYSESALTGGITLWGSTGQSTSQFFFKQNNQGSPALGNHGYCTGDFNTYFVMDTTNRGWVFRNASTDTNVASISNAGGITSTRNSDNLRLETSSNPSNYYAIIEANHNYGKAFAIRAKGAGGEHEIMKWADAAGLEFNGGANSIIKFSGDNLSSIGNITASGNISTTGSQSKIDMIYVDSGSGAGWDTRIHIGRTDDLPNGTSFPTYTATGGYGIQFQNNSDGVFFGIEQYSTGNFRPLLNWGDDTTDTPFRVAFNNGTRFQFTYDGNFIANANVTAYSDVRLKENIETIPDALEKVRQIRGVTFTRNDQKDTEKRHMGVIAQELEAAGVSEVVEYDAENDVKTVAYGNMVGLLIEAIKEQSAQIESLNKRIEELENGNH